MRGSPWGPLNHHPANTGLHFWEEAHRYDINGIPFSASVTKLIKRGETPFNADLVAWMVVNSKKQPRPDKYAALYDEDAGVFHENVLESWNKACSDGTNVHALAERHSKWGVVYSRGEYQDEYSYYEEYKAWMEGQGWTICGAEMMVFSLRYDVAGCVDLLWKRGAGAQTQFMLSDYKRQPHNPEKYSDKKKIRGYRKQLHFYRMLLEQRYFTADFPFTYQSCIRGQVVRLHPSSGKFIVIPIDLSGDSEQFLERARIIGPQYPREPHQLWEGDRNMMRIEESTTTNDHLVTATVGRKRKRETPWDELFRDSKKMKF